MTRYLTEQEYQQRKSKRLSDATMGALMTGLMALIAIYTASAVVITIAGFFAFCEVERLYRYFKLCRLHDRLVG